MPETRQTVRLAGRLLPAVLVWLAFALLPQTLPGRKLELLGFDLFTMASAPARSPS